MSQPNLLFYQFFRLLSFLSLTLLVWVQQVSSQPNPTLPIANQTSIDLSSEKINQLLDRSLKIGDIAPFQVEQLNELSNEYLSISERFSTSQNVSIEAKLAQVVLAIGQAYQRNVKDDSKATSIYAAGISRWGTRTEAEIAQYVVSMHIQNLLLIARLQADRALQIYDRVAAQYQPIQDTRVQAAVIRLLGAKGQLLVKLSRVNDGLAVFDTVEKMYSNPSDEILALALAENNVVKADQYIELGKKAEAITLLETVLKKWGTRSEQSIQTLMQHTVLRLAMQAASQSKLDESIVFYEELLIRTEKNPNSGFFLRAKINIPHLLHKQQKYQQSLTACEQFLAFYESSVTNDEQIGVARIMLLKASNLMNLKKNQESIKTLDQLLAKYANSTIPQMLQLVDEARRGKSYMQRSELFPQRNLFIR